MISISISFGSKEPENDLLPQVASPPTTHLYLFISYQPITNVRMSNCSLQLLQFPVCGYLQSSPQMASSNNEMDYEFLPFLRVYKNGEVERLINTDSIPAGTDPQTGVSSKDVTNIIPETEVYVRIFLPKLNNVTRKIPLLVYFHGGGFVVSTPSSPIYHHYLEALVSESQVIAVSVHYRRPPEHPLPTAYEDSLAALQWVISHSNGDGPEEWLNNYADFGRLFLSGDSAGGNIVHNLLFAIGNYELGLNVPILGASLVHPYFWGSDSIGSEAVDPDRKASVDRLWPLVCPSNPDNDDPRVNPLAEDGPGLMDLGCMRVLVCVAENDILKDRGWAYFHRLGQSGWIGVVEIYESEGEDHAFHLHDLQCGKAKELITRMAAFFNRDVPPMFQ